MTQTPDILCIGSVLWDVIGRSTRAMQAGSDVPGRITRLPGGVAMNIAMTLKRFDLQTALLSVVGQAVVSFSHVDVKVFRHCDRFL